MKSGNHLSNFPDMPEITQQFNTNEIFNQSNLITEELAYDPEILKESLTNDLPKLNNEQKNVYDKLINRINSSTGENVFFIDGSGGTGKTFVYKLILAQVRL